LESILEFSSVYAGISKGRGRGAKEEKVLKIQHGVWGRSPMHSPGVWAAGGFGGLGAKPSSR